MAIPRLAERVGVTPRVIRYWEEQGLISPTSEHGRLRYSPRDTATARLIKRLLDAGYGVEAIRTLKTLAQREIRSAAACRRRRGSPRRDRPAPPVPAQEVPGGDRNGRGALPGGRPSPSSSTTPTSPPRAQGARRTEERGPSKAWSGELIDG